MIWNSIVVLWKKAVGHNEETASTGQSSSFQSLHLCHFCNCCKMFPPFQSGSCLWCKHGLYAEVVDWETFLAQIPLYDFAKLQCCCVPSFLHQHTLSELSFLFPLSFYFWKAGLLQERSGLVFEPALEQCLCPGLLMFPSMTELFCPA